MKLPKCMPSRKDSIKNRGKARGLGNFTFPESAAVAFFTGDDFRHPSKSAGDLCDSRADGWSVRGSRDGGNDIGWHGYGRHVGRHALLPAQGSAGGRMPEMPAYGGVCVANPRSAGQHEYRGGAYRRGSDPDTDE